MVKRFKLVSISAALFILMILGCAKKDTTSTVVNESATLTGIDFDLNGSIFTAIVNDKTITLDRNLPFGTNKVTVNNVYLLDNCTSNLNKGDLINVTTSNNTIIVKNSNSKNETTYQLQFPIKSYKSIVEKNGLLEVNGNKIVNKDKIPVSLAGNSFFWSNKGWGGENYYKSQIVSWLALDWETTIVRAAMGVDADGGYLQDKAGNMAKVKTIVDAAIANGLYVIIDWHTENAYKYPEEAVDFFTQMATLYGNNDNIIYEIFNEPLEISWHNTLKPYAEKVITAIRKVDPDNLIIVGTPTWSQRVDLAAADPITISKNIAYTLHFYTVYHKQALRDVATNAINAGLPIFVTEWGPIGYTQNDPEADKWMEWCKANKISHCAWSVNDKAEEWSIVKTGAFNMAIWNDLQLTESGKLERKYIRSWAK